MLDNSQLIYDILEKEQRAVKVLLEMLNKFDNGEYGHLILNYEAGKITCIKSEKSIK